MIELNLIVHSLHKNTIIKYSNRIYRSYMLYTKI